MHPLLIAGYLLNLLLINGVYGWLGLLGSIVVSGLIYYFMSKGKGVKAKHIANLVAFAAVYAIGVVAIFNAEWGNVILSAGILIMEIFVFAIFSAMSRI